MFIKGTPGVSSHPKLHTYEEGYLLPVLTGETLLFGQRHKGLLRQLRDLSGATTDEFDRSYGILLTHFMEFVQVLPHKSNGILGSLLNYSLARACAVFQKYCHARKAQATPLFKFAVFSAALLKDVGRVITNQRVVLVDDQGDFQSDWNPFSGSMVGQTDFYKMYQIGPSYLRIEAEVTPLIARQLISRDVFLWLSSDLSVFSDWLAALLGQEGVGSKEITWALALVKREDILAILNTIDGAGIEMSESIATEQGEAFYKWLKEGIDKGEIAVNSDDAGIHVVNEGVLIEHKIVKQFATAARMSENFRVIFQQFVNIMGVGKINGNDFLVAKYFAPTESTGTNYGAFTGGMTQRARTVHEGVVVNKDAIFTKKENTSKSTLQSAQSMANANHQQPSQKSETVSPKIDLDNTMM